MPEVTARRGPGSPLDRAKAMARRDAAEPGRTAGDPADPGPQPTRPAVVLIGPPGSGKSSVGAALARMTGMSLRDTDVDIERGTGRTIADIFLQDGEPRFRELERAAVAGALVEHTGVLALGGGAILAPETRTVLAGHPVVFLNLSMPTGVRRTGLGGNRPLLAGVNPRATYKALLDARLGLYRETARLEIQTDHLSVAEVAAVIIDDLRLA